MNIDKARDIVAHVIEQRRRWGIQLSAKDFNFDDLLDGLVALGQHGDDIAIEVNASVAKANKEAGAAKARAQRAQKTVDELRAKVADLESKGKAWQKHVKTVEEQRDRFKAELEIKS